ncbi:AmmeMemoRadiSam system radical SAM enzyme [Neptunomonas antarctica]|uniref:Pyruvate formate lyase activating enzyme n=1 Tax=Neptunomonas antarctica TaxID=619304 RepID=A0A1N7PH69_9GAMM|nr:AmmeMemoRadiSam system radical SAM enzyme [Neptunomonas antarctica]SIT10003.1 pyruvate formate lyase activating enzyme [Neptunomonas antarctica]
MNPDQHKTLFWHKLDNDRIQCDLCPHHCSLREGQRGVCYVRGHENGQMKLHTYGRSSGFCIDPIEKKPLNHFLPGTPVLSFGTAGCNLTCKFCQNWDISKARDMDHLSDQASPEQLAITAKHYKCRSIAFTYNDPVIFLEYAEDVAAACRAEGIKSIAVTAGYITDIARPRFFSSFDAVNVDLKAFTEDFYQHICGGQLSTVLDTLLYLKRETTIWFEITTLLIPGKNDSEQEIEALSKWIYDNLGPDVPLHFSAFHPDWKMLDTPPTPVATLLRARNVALKNGIRYVYIGNVHHPEASSTHCHHCKHLLIERDWYELGQWNIHDGKCRKCATPIPGIFENEPGTWGAKRQPVRIQPV